MRHISVVVILHVVLSIGAATQALAVLTSVGVGSFTQEVHTPYTEAGGQPPSEAHSIAYVDGHGVYAATAEGLVQFVDGSWSPLPGLSDKRPHLVEPVTGALLAATKRAVYRVSDQGVEVLVDPVAADVTALTMNGQILWIGTVDGLYTQEAGRLEPVKDLNLLLHSDTRIRSLSTHGGEVAIATQDGVYLMEAGNWRPEFAQDGDRRWAPLDVRAVTYDLQGRLWFACPQGVGYREQKDEWKLFSGRDGLPYNDFTSVAAGVDGTVWFGTGHGAVKYEGGVWGYREGRRWLNDNEVRDVAITPEGDVWFATAGGVTRIEARTMTLAAKAAFFEDEIDKYHRRTPYGYVVNASLRVPGDKSTATPYVTDNDGQYTGLYVGAECLAYAATKNRRFKERATNGFEALAFLSEVTQGGSHPAPPGFVSRAIMPTSGPDPNAQDNPERDRKVQAERDRLWKILDPRWPVNEDGQWYWKTDTSSDELDGHYFAYGLYYDHVAESKVEKERCQEVVRRVTDHLIAHDYRLFDHDGKPTRWARFSPQDLNEDSAWWTERGLNSMSVLTYLTVAHHVTGDQKYRDAYLNLVEEHQYALNALCMPKLQFGPGSFVQFDDKMAFMNYYHLVRYETDPELLKMYYTSIYYYWNIEKYELNPFFNFVYAACCQGKVRTDQWGDLDVSPTGDWLGQSIDTLKRYPLDLVDWKMTNTHRIDILPLPDHVREPGDNEGKGYRVNGYVLPIDERQALSWSEDPWALETGGDGRRLRDGCPYLLAYYMGLHHGFLIE